MTYGPIAKALTAKQAIVAVNQGKVIAYPTEAVWGLGCDPFNAEAVKTLLKLKKRPVEKGLILVVASYAQLEPLLAESVTLEQRELIQRPRAKPTTWLVPFKPDKVPRWISGEHDTVAVRISAHSMVKALCEEAGGPIVSTSANPQGCQPAREAFQVQRYFKNQVQICRGRIGNSAQASTIKDLLTGAIIRA
jgi:L-threonylcarbamoyladenylate synthase